MAARLGPKKVRRHTMTMALGLATRVEDAERNGCDRKLDSQPWRRPHAAGCGSGEATRQWQWTTMSMELGHREAEGQ